MEFNDGLEVAPKNATLATLGRDRISQRVLGSFGFSDVLRSLDGAQYVLSTPTLNLTAIAARPTEGVFQVNGWAELNINVFYGALTGQVGTDRHPGAWRLFGLGDHDYRQGVAKTDNRPAAVRNADSESIVIGTYGGNYLHVAATPAGPFDLLVWGAVQTGAWGTLTHRAGAIAAEVGWQPAGLPALRPWICGGYDYSSGDPDPADDRHGTFFPVLPTARLYARMPFFNLMNSVDLFGELILRPSNRLTLRADVHALRLADKNDLWYSGGGAFQPGTFGFSGRPSNGQTGLATLYDVSGDVALNPHVAFGLLLRVRPQPGGGAHDFPGRQRRPLRLHRMAGSLVTDSFCANSHSPAALRAAMATTPAHCAGVGRTCATVAPNWTRTSAPMTRKSTVRGIRVER